MVSPVTGPFVKTVGNTGTKNSYTSVQEGWKQAKPYDQVLPYDRRVCSVKWSSLYSDGSDPIFDASSLAAGFHMISQVETWDTWSHLENRLYDKFKNAVSDRAEMGVAMMEIGKSYSMIQKRAIQLAKFAGHLRRRRFAKAAEALGMQVAPKGANVAKGFAGNYLEFHFGWSPMIGDIFNAVQVLQEPIKSPWIRVGVKEVEKVYNLSTPTSGFNTTAWLPNDYSWSFHRRWVGSRAMQCGAQVQVSNPNLWLANQMGLVNPASIAWELVPFSFVVDWFVNVGQVINAMSDFYGLTLTKTWTTKRYKGVASYLDHATYRWQSYVNGSWQTYWGWRHRSTQGPFAHVIRRAGLPQPVLAVRPWRAWHWRRTASAVALMVQLTTRG